MWVISPRATWHLLGTCVAPGRRSDPVRIDIDPGEQRLRGRKAASLPGVRAPPTGGPPRRTSISVGGPGVAVAELLEDAWREAGHERRRCQRDEAARLHEVTEHTAQAVAGRLVAALPPLGERPRLLRIDQLVGRPDEVPE